MDLLQKSGKYDYYDICRKLLLLSGQWPYQKLGQRLFCTGLIVTWNFTILFVQIANYFVCETLECILKTLPMNLMAVTALVKLLTYHFNRQEMKGLIEHLSADWNILCCEEEFDIMKRHAETGRLYSLLYTTYVYVVSLLFGSTALLPRFMDVVFPLNESRPTVLPCPSYYFVDEDEYFYYIFFHLQIGASICMTGVVMHDCNFFTFIEHVCGLFAIAGYRLEHVLYKRNITDKDLIDPSDDVYVKNIVFSIQAHRKALQFTALLENTFSSSFGLQIIIVIMGMSVSLIQISSELQGDLAELVRYVLFVFGQLLHIFILSFQGQQLINHSLELHTKIYNGPWYKIPVKVQQLIMFTMRKTIESSSVTAGKIFIFCLESFTSIMQCSVSYFTVLSSFNEP